jgi:amidophosphoribosyltransferase
LRIASPPTTHSCFYGVDTPERSKLIASRMSVKEMADYIKVDSLEFLTMDGLYRAVGEQSRATGAGRFCDACFSGDYPIRLTDFERKAAAEIEERLAPRAENLVELPRVGKAG